MLMDRDDAIAKYGPPDENGHITRFSDSSVYDAICVMCGARDFIMGMGDGGRSYYERCPEAPTEESAKFTKSPGYDWSVKYQYDGEPPETMLVFGQMFIEQVVIEARISLDGIDRMNAGTYEILSVWRG